MPRQEGALHLYKNRRRGDHPYPARGKYDEAKSGKTRLQSDFEALIGAMCMKYEIILYQSEYDNAYIAEGPELSGCMADGPATEEAPCNVELITQKQIEVVRELECPVPELKGRLKYA